ncbi:hypothetical protein A8G00_10460 [Sphingobium sp. SA916]|nr:hypothetical protein A8G00_10460 [Sphingobium sp. SA916]
MQSDNHTDPAGPEPDWAERFCLAWEAGVEVLCGLVGIGVGLMLLSGLVALAVALPIPAAIFCGAIIIVMSLQRGCCRQRE